MSSTKTGRQFPQASIESDYRRIYEDDQLTLGAPELADQLLQSAVRRNSIIVAGIELGDEGKGRIVDNKLAELTKIPGIRRVHVIRFQGGNNAGHTIDTGETKIALHQVPSGVFYPEAVGIMDAGMIVHPEDLRTEIEYSEEAVGDLRGKLILSPDATMCTDLERAEEILNRIKSGKSGGGTGRGIAPSVAHGYDRTGVRIGDLLEEDWEQSFRERYKRYELEFIIHSQHLSLMGVPDFAGTKRTGEAQVRAVGNIEEYIARLADTRSWLIDRDLVKDTYVVHHDAFNDMSTGILFEGAQGLGLHPQLGTYPDVTSTDTSVYGVRAGTRFWNPGDIESKFGVFKITYTSSIGARRMPTEVPIPAEVDPSDMSVDERWAQFVRDEAHEYGTTTGRPRDVCHLDLPFLTYNARMSGINAMVGTHLDIAREGETIRVCTHYTRDGRIVPYQPNLKYLKGVEPQYTELPGWDGKAVQEARTIDDLPHEALQFLAFIQARTGFPIVTVTTGPRREQIVEIPYVE